MDKRVAFLFDSNEHLQKFIDIVLRPIGFKFFTSDIDTSSLSLLVYHNMKSIFGESADPNVYVERKYEYVDFRKLSENQPYFFCGSPENSKLIASFLDDIGLVVKDDRSYDWISVYEDGMYNCVNFVNRHDFYPRYYIQDLFGETNMKQEKYIAVVNDDIYLFEALQKKAFSLGWQWQDSGTNVSNLDSSKVRFNLSNKQIVILGSATSKTYCLSTEWKSIVEFLSRNPDITIGDYKVEFCKDSIKVGCQTVSHAVIKEIYDRIFGEKKGN